MASAEIFAATSSFTSAVELLNAIGVKVLRRLLGRVVPKLHQRVARLFTAEEEKQLQTMLGLSAGDLATVLNACTFIFEQAGHHALKPAALRSHLERTGLSADHTAVFVEVWESEGPSLLRALKGRTLGGPLVLKDSKWQLQMQLGQRAITKLKEPSVLFQFALGDADADAEASERVTVEFSHSELFQFFDKIERVQEQLDTIGYS